MPFHVIPSVVVRIQVRLHTLSLDVALHNIVNEVLQESPIPPEGSEGERLYAPTTPFVSVLCTREPYLKRSAAVPEPMFAGRRNHGDPFITYRRIQIHVANSLKKPLLQK